MLKKSKLKKDFILLLIIFISGIIINSGIVSAEINIENEEDSLSEQTLSANFASSEKFDANSDASSTRIQSYINPQGFNFDRKTNRFIESVLCETGITDDNTRGLEFDQVPQIDPQIGDVLAYGNPDSYSPFDHKWEVVEILSPQEVVINYTEFNEATQTEQVIDSYVVDTHTREVIGASSLFPYWLNPADFFVGANVDLWSIGGGEGDVFAEGVYNYYGEIITIWLVDTGWEYFYFVKDTGVVIAVVDYSYNPYFVGTYINVLSPGDEIHNIRQIGSDIEVNQTGYVIPVFVHNTGHFTESLAVEIYEDSSLASTENIILTSGEYRYLVLEWNPIVPSIYFVEIISAAVPGETYLTDNSYSFEYSTLLPKQYELNICPFQWISTVGGSNLGLSGDDVYTSVGLPFEFFFYNQNFTTIYVSSNGWLSFTETMPYAYWTVPLPRDDFNHVIAPYWIDLTASNNIYVLSTPDYLVIEYNNIYHLSGGLAGTFQVILYSTGDIVFTYLDMETDPGAVVGLNFGLDLSYYTAFTDGLSDVNNFAMEFSLMDGSGVFAINVYDDNTLDPIQNAQLNVYNDTGHQIATGLSDINGFYKAVGLTSGNYQVDIFAIGYYSTSQIEYVEESGIFIIDVYLEPLPVRNILIISPTEGQTVEGGVVYIEFTAPNMSDIVLVDMFVNDVWIANVTSLYSEYICVPVFENGTNIIRLEFRWLDTGSAFVELSVESINVIPLYIIDDGDYFLLTVEFPDGGMFMQQNFTFVWYSEFELNVTCTMRSYDINDTTLDYMEYYVRVNILNGYITDSDIPGFIASHFALFNRITPETTIGDPFISSVWSDIAFIENSIVWRGNEVWTVTLIGGIILYIHKESGFFIYEYIPPTSYVEGFGFVETNIFELLYKPDISPEYDYEYDYSTTGHSLSWYAFDEDPAVYEIYLDGELISTDSWVSGTLIIIDIDGLEVGIYNYTIVVIDNEGNSASDTVIVTVNAVIAEFNLLFNLLTLLTIMCITLVLVYKKRKFQVAK
ncbi:MAG: carboxypeptidase-like regulatory domain-containing protein [Candidatus Heimdallarchaeaceae archaeon]